MIDFSAKTEIVETPLGKLEIRTMRYSETQRLATDGDQTSFMLGMLADCVIEDGKPVGTPDEWDRLAGSDTDAVLAVFGEVCRINGYKPEVIEKN